MLLFLDSLGDHYTAAQVTTKWTTAQSPVRRTGLHGYGMGGNLRKGLVFGSTTVIMEAYVHRPTSSPPSLFWLIDDNQVAQIHLEVLGDGRLAVYRWGSNPAVDLIANTAPDLFRQNIWYHVGWTVHVHQTAGSVEVRLNGGTVINVTGVNTTASASVSWSGTLGSVSIGDNGASGTFDDLVVMDNVDDGLNDPRLPGGGGFDKFLGPVEITVKRPNGAGTLAEWTPSPAVANWQNVADIEPDDDTTYNAAGAAAVGTSDLLAMEDLAVDQDVVAVQSLVSARKTEEGIAAVARLVRDSSTTYVGATVYQPNLYSYMIRPEPTLPDGSLWTKTRWNAIAYGYRRIV